MQRNAQLRNQIAQALRDFDVRAHRGPAQRSAAVALVLTDAGHGADVYGLPGHDTWNEAAAVVLTRRSGKLRNHAGQWALPGGRIDAGETPEQTALRELAEEVGVVLQPEDVLGRLDDFATRSGYVITPVVLWAGGRHEMLPNADEVASAHRIPVTELLREDAPLLERIAESAHPVLRMPIGESWIAAPTAAVLYQFREVCLLGRPTRVAHFEQPLFAWK